MTPLAKHTLLEMRGCDPTVLRDREALAPLLLAAVREAGATIVAEVFHNFSPHGVSGVIVIAESHVAIHTWPEHEFAAVDIFSCSETLDHAAVAGAVQTALRAAGVEVRTFERGLPTSLAPRSRLNPSRTRKCRNASSGDRGRLGG